MKKVMLVVSILFLLIISCKSKSVVVIKSLQKEVNYIPYYLKVYEADSLFIVGDFERSYQILDSLFKIYEPINTDTYCEYGIYLGSAVMSDHYDNIEEKVRFGIRTFGNISANHKYSVAINTSVFKAAHITKSDLKLLNNDYFNKLNHNLRNELLSMSKNDQDVRNENINNKNIEIVDEENAKKLQIIFQTFNYPSNKLIGTNNAFDDSDINSINLKILLLHQTENFKLKYLPLIFENLKRGNCDPEIYAAVYDRSMLENTNKQYYGTYFCPDGSLCLLLDKNKLNSIRKEIGLPHIKYQQWKVKNIQKD